MILAILMLFTFPPPERTRSEIVAARQKLYPDLWQIVEQARAVPPEFSAWALLRVAGVRRVEDREWRRELIQEAFEQAQHASDPMPLRFAAQPPALVRAQVIANGHKHGLDRLSLSSTAVIAMAGLDQKAAAEMFAAIPPPSPRILTCQDSLWEDPAPYYHALARLIANRRLTDEDIHNLLAVIGTVRSPAEIAPVAALLSNLKAAPEDWEALAIAFSGALARIEYDDRAFLSRIKENDAEVHRLFERSRPTAALIPLVSAYRAYLVRHLTGIRCADSRHGWEAEAVKRFNQFVTAMPAGAVGPITAEEQKPAKVEGRAAAEPIFPPGSKPAGDAFTRLLTRNGRVISDDEKQSAEWRQSFDEYLAELDTIAGASGLTPAAAYHLRLRHLAIAVMAAPQGELRTRVLRDYATLLASAPLQHENPIEWFAGVDDLLVLGRTSLKSARAELLQALAATGHSVLALCARLEQTISSR